MGRTRMNLVHQLQLVGSKRLKIATQTGIRTVMAEQPWFPGSPQPGLDLQSGYPLEFGDVVGDADRVEGARVRRNSMSYAPIGVPFFSWDTRIEA